MGNDILMLAVKETLLFLSARLRLWLGKSNISRDKASFQTTVNQGHIPIVEGYKWTQGIQQIRWSEKQGT